MNFLKSDYIECLKLAISSDTTNGNHVALDIIEQTERTLKVLYDKQIRGKKEIIEENRYPMIVEQEALKFNLKKSKST